MKTLSYIVGAAFAEYVGTWDRDEEIPANIALDGNISCTSKIELL